MNTDNDEAVFHVRRTMRECLTKHTGVHNSKEFAISQFPFQVAHQFGSDVRGLLTASRLDNNFFLTKRNTVSLLSQPFSR